MRARRALPKLSALFTLPPMELCAPAKTPRRISGIFRLRARRRSGTRSLRGPLAAALLCLAAIPVGLAAPSELGRPILRNYPETLFERSGRIWSAVQDRDGVMYFGSFSATVTFDGADWDAIEMSYARNIRGLARAPDGTLYAGGNNQVGFFRPARGGKKEFVSLVEHVPAEHRDFREVTAIVAHGEVVTFATERKILQWNRGAFRVRELEGAGTFATERELLLHRRGEALRRITESGRIEPVIPAGLVGELELAFALSTPTARGLLLGTVDGRLFVWDGTQLTPRPTGVDSLLRRAGLRQGHFLPDGALALALRTGGVVIIDAAGQLLTRVDESTGLAHNAVRAFFTDREGGVWLCHDNGISRLEWPPHITTFSDANGLHRGTTVAYARHEGLLYVASANGVRRLIPGEGGGRFEVVPGLTAARDFLTEPDGLFSGDQVGLAQLVDGRFERVFTFARPSAAPMRFARSTANPRRVWVAQPEGLRSLLRADDGAWSDEGFIAGFDLPADTVLEDARGTVWVVSRFVGFFRVHFERATPAERGTPRVEPLLGPDFGLPAKLAANNWVSLWRGEPLFNTDYSVYRFDDAARRFVPMEDVGAALNRPPIVTGAVNTASPDHLWVYVHTTGPGPGDARGMRFFQMARSGEWRQLPHYANNVVGTTSLNGLYVETGDDGRSVLWAGGTQGLIRAEIPAALLVDRARPPLVRADALPSDEPWPGPVNRDVTDYRLGPPPAPAPEATPLDFAAQDTLPAERNAVRFRFVSPRHQADADVEYQTKLEGLDREWSAWSPARQRVITSLAPGHYTFRVRARDSDGQTSESEPFSFSLAPPWWRTWWAVAFYGLAAVGSVAGFVRWRVWSLRRRNEALEILVRDRTQELRQNEAELRDARDAAESANRAKSAFLASMSHELRTPLNAVLGYAQLLRRSPRTAPENLHQVEIIHQSAEHLLQLINEVLDIAKIEAGRIDLLPAPMSLPGLLDHLDEVFSLRAVQKGLAFALHRHPPLPEHIVADETRLRQVLSNLLGNAVKFTAQGRIDFHVACVDGRLRFSVEDTGPGIPEAERRAIFRPFYQATGPALAAQGAGLGLAISQRLLRLMGGEIFVQSTVGRGSRFWCELPLVKSEVAAVTPRVFRLPEGYTGARRRVLVVDDETVNRGYLRALLEPLGFLIDEADDGTTALAQARGQRPELVLLDLRLRTLDGLPTAQQLRAEFGDAVRIIAISASVYPDDRRRALEAGCDEFVPKPVREALLLDAIGRLLKLEWRWAEPLTGSGTPFIPETLPRTWTTPDEALVTELEALVELGDMVSLRNRLATARQEYGATEYFAVLDAFASGARLQQLREWLASARRRSPTP